ncbi:uncharacterized protein BT62DRAFT_1071082 [Guyanagaster necrorhizus]|uniref:Uncharacterized protein n=1 Tax=Guyanagaster necrorhizus TaxID=856835 RepID=A0A9P7W210_9AGAR|nr:uncharacterized protein BT62DRAFT_1071082 [Guyanagaster necrorhizus MCA 3950]KAG7451876.1 hypothetical protein BT62DRAFT_1071082 [Guyanagaster necrorhizus MCA 3950]
MKFEISSQPCVPIFPPPKVRDRSNTANLNSIPSRMGWFLLVRPITSQSRWYIDPTRDGVASSCSNAYGFTCLSHLSFVLDPHIEAVAADLSRNNYSHTGLIDASPDLQPRAIFSSRIRSGSCRGNLFPLYSPSTSVASEVELFIHPTKHERRCPKLVLHVVLSGCPFDEKGVVIRSLATPGQVPRPLKDLV